MGIPNAPGTHTSSSRGSGRSNRRPPHKTTSSQKQFLLAEFECNPNPGAHERERIAHALNVERRIVKNWFSNQRALRRRMLVDQEEAGGSEESRGCASESGSRRRCLTDDPEECVRDMGKIGSPEHDDEMDTDGEDGHSPVCTPVNVYPHHVSRPAAIGNPYPSPPSTAPSPVLTSSLRLPPLELRPVPQYRKEICTPPPPRLYETPARQLFYEIPLCYPESALRSSLSFAGMVSVS